MYDRFFMPFTAKFESSKCMNVLFSENLFSLVCAMVVFFFFFNYFA